jgi:putative transposase
MNGLAPHALVPGVRFALKNTAYEISFADGLTVRYVSCQGGNQHQIPISVFWKLVEENEIGFLAPGTDDLSITTQTPESRILTDSAREEMLRRFGYVKHALETGGAPTGLENLRRAIATGYEQEVEREEHTGKQAGRIPATSTLARWIKLYVNSGGSPMSLAPQTSKRGCRSRKYSLIIENTIARVIADHYLTSERPSGKQIYCNVIGMLLDEGYIQTSTDLPKERTVYRRIAALDPYIVALKRNGKRYADMRFRAAGASFETTRPMQMVMIDGHRMDVIIVDAGTGESLGRANLVCLFDVETRAVIGWYISLLPFCSATALAAIKDTCSRDPSKGPGGVPESIIPDNGRDLVSIAIRSLCAKLALHFAPAKTYSPDDKAHLERFFRTLNEQLVHMLPGTTFSSPKERGEYDSKKMACCTLEKLRELFRTWIDTVYHVHVHSGTSRAPVLAWRDRNAEFPILHFSKAEMDAIARIPYRRTVNNGRVQLHDLQYKSHTLATWEAQGKRDVNVLSDELDLGFVYVCHASEPEVLVRADCTRGRYASGLTKYEHDLVKAQLKELAEKDRRELGEYALEIARWRLWNDIQGLKTQLAARKLARLTQDREKKSLSLKKTGQAKIKKSSSLSRLEDCSETCSERSSSDEPLQKNPANKSGAVEIFRNRPPPRAEGSDFETFEL